MSFDEAKLEFERQKWLSELQREDRHRAHDERGQFVEKSNRAAVETGTAGIRALILINGGASISILTFLSGALQRQIPINLSFVKSSIFCFAIGVFFAVSSLVFGYCTNYSITTYSTKEKKLNDYPFFSETVESIKWRKRAVIFIWTSVATAISSLLAFLVGIYFSTSIF